MRLRECVDALDGMTMQGSLDREITGLTDDSRRVSGETLASIGIPVIQVGDSRRA